MNTTRSESPGPATDNEAPTASAPAVRAILGGGLMGLANLVPGISGGTMLLAAGVYSEFIESVAAVSRLRFQRRGVIVLGLVAGAAVIAIALLAGPVRDLVVGHRWLAYSAFVGLTLGGVPELWRITRPMTGRVALGLAVGLLLMFGLGALQQAGASAATLIGDGIAARFIAGAAGAASMILPGVSGGYLLLLLGQYIPILDAIDQLVDAARALDIAAATDPFLTTVIPVGVGLVLGIAAMSNLLRWLLRNQREATLGFLLGLLLGVVVGLWPFQQGAPPQVGDVLKGQQVTTENQAAFDPVDWRVEVFTPTPSQVGAAVALVLAGAAATSAIGRLGRD